jgi:acetyl-CoA C-acetyltransferase
MESPRFVEQAEGPAIVETYTVIFNRVGEPEQGIVIGRLDNASGARFFANTRPARDLMLTMTREEFLGHAGLVSADGDTGRNLLEPC